jgi:hypothetical protein
MPLPLRQFTNSICTEQIPTVSIILPLIKKLEKTIVIAANDAHITRQIKEAVIENISARYYIIADTIHLHYAANMSNQ